MRIISVAGVALLAAGGCAPETPRPAANAGEQAFQICLTCHSPAAENRPTGPNLHGLFGRPAAASDGYFYSEALRRSGIVWDDATLDAYLANPLASVPGTFMIVSVPDAQRRTAIIEYLRTMK